MPTEVISETIASSRDPHVSGRGAGILTVTVQRPASAPLAESFEPIVRVLTLGVVWARPVAVRRIAQR